MEPATQREIDRGNLASGIGKTVLGGVGALTLSPFSAVRRGVASATGSVMPTNQYDEQSAAVLSSGLGDLKAAAEGGASRVGDAVRGVFGLEKAPAPAGMPAPAQAAPATSIPAAPQAAQPAAQPAVDPNAWRDDAHKRAIERMNTQAQLDLNAAQAANAPAPTAPQLPLMQAPAASSPEKDAISKFNDMQSQMQALANSTFGPGAGYAGPGEKVGYDPGGFNKLRHMEDQTKTFASGISALIGQDVARQRANQEVPLATMREETARRGQDIGAETSRRGQDITASTTREGHGVQMRGQDLTAASAAEGHENQRYATDMSHMPDFMAKMGALKAHQAGDTAGATALAGLFKPAAPSYAMGHDQVGNPVVLNKTTGEVKGGGAPNPMANPKVAAAVQKQAAAAGMTPEQYLAQIQANVQK